MIVENHLGRVNWVPKWDLVLLFMIVNLLKLTYVQLWLWILTWRSWWCSNPLLVLHSYFFFLFRYTKYFAFNRFLGMKKLMQISNCKSFFTCNAKQWRAFIWRIQKERRCELDGKYNDNLVVLDSQFRNLKWEIGGKQIVSGHLLILIMILFDNFMQWFTLFVWNKYKWLLVGLSLPWVRGIRDYLYVICQIWTTYLLVSSTNCDLGTKSKLI